MEKENENSKKGRKQPYRTLKKEGVEKLLGGGQPKRKGLGNRGACNSKKNQKNPSTRRKGEKGEGFSGKVQPDRIEEKRSRD